MTVEIRTYTAHDLFHHWGGFLGPLALPVLGTTRSNSHLRHGKNVPIAGVRITATWLTAKRVCIAPTCTPHAASRVRTSYAPTTYLPGLPLHVHVNRGSLAHVHVQRRCSRTYHCRAQLTNRLSAGINAAVPNFQTALHRRPDQPRSEAREWRIIML